MASKFNLNRIIKDAGNIKDVSASVSETHVTPIVTNTISIKKSTISFVQKIRKMLSEFFRNHKADFKYLLLMLPIIAIFLLVMAVQKEQTINSKAGGHTAQVSFQLTSWALPPESTFGVWLNASDPVAFTALELNFDPRLIKLTREVSLTSTVLTRIVKVTSKSEANTTGKIFIVLGLDPSFKTRPPTGPFQVANVTFNTNTTAPNTSTAITFNNSNMQIVSLDQSLFTLSSTNLNLTLNPVATPTPTPTPISTPRPTPSGTAAPTASPLSGPSVAIISPSDNENIKNDVINIRVKVSDPVRVTDIKIFFDGKMVKSCELSDKCSVEMKTGNMESGNHTISVNATDSNNQKGNKSITVIKP